MKLSPQQEQAFAKCVAWMRLQFKPWFYLAGYAGTGKSTIALELASQARGRVEFGAFTGKAAKVMRSKGCLGARTIHSMIYSREEVNGIVSWKLRPFPSSDVSLIVIDECSMVGEKMASDLLSFGVPILVLGDPAQLPPVGGGGGYFTSQTPDFMLTEIHRQAEGSPIIRLATAIRENRFKRMEFEADGLTIRRKSNIDRNLVLDADTVIVGRNATREAYNQRIRQLLGFSGVLPVANEMLICLKNNGSIGISNGEMFRVGAKLRTTKTPAGRAIGLRLRDPDDELREDIVVRVLQQFFEGKAAVETLSNAQRMGSEEFDFGYAITCHKSQGSQWPKVCVFDESSVFRDDRNRWLYTAVTRAAEHLTLII